MSQEKYSHTTSDMEKTDNPESTNPESTNAESSNTQSTNSESSNTESTHECPSLTGQVLGDAQLQSFVRVLHGDDTAVASVETEGPADASAEVSIGDVVSAVDPSGIIGGDCLNTDVLNGVTDGNPLLFASLSGPADGNILVGGDEGSSPHDALITADANLPEAGDVAAGDIAPDIGDLPVDLGCVGGLLDGLDLQA
jgi:hypothetical protein